MKDDLWKFNFEDDMLEDIHVSELKYTMLLAKIVDELKVCISDCKQALEEETYGSARTQCLLREMLAESLLKLIESEEVKK